MGGTRRKRQPKQLPKTRLQIGYEIKRRRPSLGSLVVAIEGARRELFIEVDRAIEAAHSPSGSGSVVGSVVQVPRCDPRHEQAIDYLETVRKTLEDLVGEAP